ncbi:hypothetical protein COO60DRAFT_408390 [Scenedesmus sp. NREL 46B-D3]|nr:hypothetical protein COO60DRAFT_408390 [Scenedesmus sp. NREL 46B-D3]
MFKRNMKPAAKQRAYIDGDEAGTWSDAARTSRSIAITLTLSSFALACGYLAGASRSMSSFQPTSKGSAAALLTLHHQSPAKLRFLTPLKSRIELGLLLQQEGLEVGAELGVQRGHFASETLQRWPKCRRYYLVDVWEPQDNYKDYANVDQAEHDKILAEARHVLGPGRAS